MFFRVPFPQAVLTNNSFHIFCKRKKKKVRDNHFNLKELTNTSYPHEAKASMPVGNCWDEAMVLVVSLHGANEASNALAGQLVADKQVC